MEEWMVCVCVYVYVCVCVHVCVCCVCVYVCVCAHVCSSVGWGVFIVLCFKALYIYIYIYTFGGSIQMIVVTWYLTVQYTEVLKCD